MVDKICAMSSFLQYRIVCDKNVKFADHIGYPEMFDTTFPRIPVDSSDVLHDYLKESIEREVSSGKAALALSGGIDSAILARFMPKGSIAYTFKCVVPGKEVTDEAPQARRYCEVNGLEQKIVEVYWEDYEKYVPVLMKRKRAPIHSIEVQIYKAALQAKNDGFEKLIFGEMADLSYGGMDKLLSKDFTLGEFCERYSHVMPYKALKEFMVITEPIVKHSKNGYVDVHSFFNDLFFQEGLNSYTNACAVAGIEFIAPYSKTLHKKLDLERIRRGENKYLVREVFKWLYPNWEIPPKMPMPRPVNEWFADWEGPKRPEFWENCHVNMTGDQKYYVWVLEKFLEVFDI